MNMNLNTNKLASEFIGLIRNAILLKARSVGLLFSLMFTLTIAACGGGGGGSDQAPSDGTVNDGINDNGVVEDGSTPAALFTVSGTLTANGVYQVDSDTNDLLTPSTDNNTILNAQAIPNPAIVKGYVTASPTGDTADRFADTADEFDFFRFTALESQSILMEIADFDTNNPVSIDLDIGLFDLSGNLLAVSQSITNSFESLLVPADGEYFLAVRAFNGSSIYTLTISTEFTTSNFDSQISVANLRLDQLKMADTPTDLDNIAFVAASQGDLVRQRNASSKSTPVLLDLEKDTLTEYLANKAISRSIADANKSKSFMSMQTAGFNTQRSTTKQDQTSMLEMVKSMNSLEGRDVFTPIDYPSVMQTLVSDPIPDRFLQWNLYDIGWNEAQSQLENLTLQKTPVIAVIDSGFFVNHPDLNSVLIDQRDFVAPVFDGDGFVADASEDVVIDDDPLCHVFHGTHVATTAVAPQNDIGITGVNPLANLIGIKIGHSISSGFGGCGLLVGDLGNAVLYAAGLPNSSGSVPAVPADVINLSLGSRIESPELVDAIAQATAQGVIVVAAAGNDGAPITNFPAASENVIAVAATDTLEQRAVYSSFYPQVDIAAPGGDIRVDQNGDGFDDGVVAGVAAINGNAFQAAYGSQNGTSMASPHVAAGIALMKGIAPGLRHDDIQAMLAAGDLTVDIAAPGFDNQTGFGLMSLPRMIERAVQFNAGDGIDGGPADTEAVAVTTSTPSSLDFGIALDQISLNLVRLGDDDISVDSIAGSDSLLLSDGTFPISIAAPDTANGFGVYSFVLNRGSIEGGTVSGSISFNMSDGSTYIVPVSAINLVSQGVASVGAVFFIIERLNDDGTFEQLPEQFINPDGLSGQVPTSPALAAGSYRIIFGTDTDKDSTICDQGELCGTLPFNNFGFESVFTLSENITDASYLLQDVSNVALTDFSGTTVPAITPRVLNEEQTLTNR